MTAEFGRSDYDQLIKVGSLTPGEPRFVIRAQDECAGDAVRAWAAIAHGKGAPIEAVELALQQADRIDAWPTKKRPDGPDLDENQRKGLRNLFGRRAWNNRVVPDVASAMAEQLGRSAIIGQIRPLLDEVLRRSEWGDDGRLIYDPPRGPAGAPDLDACPLTRLFRAIGSDARVRHAILTEAPDGS